jgi:hypothetical protein
MAADPQDAPRHAGQVVRRVLLRRNADAVQAVLRAGTPSRPPRRGRGTGNDGPVSTATASSFLNAAGTMGG